MHFNGSPRSHLVENQDVVIVIFGANGVAPLPVVIWRRLTVPLSLPELPRHTKVRNHYLRRPALCLPR